MSRRKLVKVIMFCRAHVSVSISRRSLYALPSVDVYVAA